MREIPSVESATSRSDTTQPSLGRLLGWVRDAVAQRHSHRMPPVRNIVLEPLEPRILLSASAGVDPVLFVPGFGGTVASDISTAGLQEWLLTRGIAPTKLQFDPLSNAYSDIVQTLQNVGYSLNTVEAGKTPLYAATWDWRTPVAPTDGTVNGVLTGVNAQLADNGNPSALFQSGVDYFGWWLKKAADDWFAATGEVLQKVDVVTHSTGGLVARAYIQSDAYGVGLPTIDDLVLVGVPSEGVSSTFNMLQNDWSDKPATRVLSRVVDAAWDLMVTEGRTILGPSGDAIRFSDFTFADLAADQRRFADRYVGSLGSLLGTYEFLDSNGDGAFELGTGQFRNGMLFDLNGAADQDAFIDATGRTTVVFSGESSTDTRVERRVGPAASAGLENEVLPFTRYFGQIPSSGQVWFRDLPVEGGGDGTVPELSALPSWFSRTNSRLRVNEITAAQAGEVVGHSELVQNRTGQSRVLDAIGVTGYNQSDISTGLAKSSLESLLFAIDIGLVDPLEMADEAAAQGGQLVDKLFSWGVDVVAELASPLGRIPFVMELADRFGGFVFGDDDEVIIIGTANDDQFLVRDASSTSLGRTEVISLNNTIAPHAFDNPGTRLRLLLGAGQDTVRIASVDALFSADVVIEDIDDISIAGTISVPKDFRVTAGGRLRVLDEANITAGGDIGLLVNASFALDLLSLTPVYRELNATAKIEIGDATLDANNITLASSATTRQISRFELFEGGLLGILAGFQGAELTGAPRLTFSDGPTSRATIRRSDGSWLADGFEAGKSIKVVGSAANDGDYEIAEVTVSELILVEEDVLRNEANVEGVVVAEIATTLLPEDVPLIATDENGNRRPTVGAITSQGLGNLLLGQVASSGVLDFASPADAVFAKATSGVDIAAGALIKARTDVLVESGALSQVLLDNPSMILGVSYLDSDAQATTRVAGGAVIEAGRDVDIKALVTNDMTAKAGANASIVLGLVGKFLKVPGPQITFAYGRGNSVSEAEVAEGARITGRNVAVRSGNDNDFQVSAVSNAKPQAGLGAAISVAISDVDSRSDAHVGGTIEATGNVVVDANAINTKNQITANAVVKNKPPLADKLQGVKDKITSIGPKVRTDPGTLDIAGGVAFVVSTNEATARIDPTGLVSASGAVDVTARAEDNFKTIAIGNAKASGKASIGGAVSIAEYSNKANAYLNDGARANAGGKLTVRADAVIPNQVEIDDDLRAITNLDMPEFTFDTSSALSLYGSVDTNLIRLSQTLDTLGRITPYLSATLGLDTKIATSYVAAGAEAGDKDFGDPGRFGISGAVSLLEVTNEAQAWIGQGALVNAAATPSAGADQNVVVHANASVEMVNIYGIPSILNLISPATKSEGSAVGGTYGGVTVGNRAKAHVRDGAVVKAEDDIEVSSDVHALAVNVTESGGSAKKFGLVGSIAVNDFDNVSEAWVEDGAALDAGRDVKLDASHDTLAVIITGTVSRSQSMGVGASVAFNEIDATTRSFVGNVTTTTLPDTRGVTLTLRNQATGDTITRATGSWTADGIRAGQTIRLDGAGSNSGEFRVAAISDDGKTLTLDPTEPRLTDTTTTGILVSRVGTVDAGRDLTVTAESDEKLISVAIAAAVASAEPPAQPVAGEDASASKSVQSDAAGTAQSKGGVGISGDVSINDVNDTTHAFVTGGGRITVGRDLAILADNDLLGIAVSGAFALEFTKGQGGVALAGSFTMNDIDRNVRAYTQDVRIKAGSAKIDAVTNDRLISVTAGAAGTRPSGTAAIAGSVNLNLIDSDTQSGVWSGTVLEVTQDVSLRAHDDLFAVSVAGGFSLSGKAGIGAAVDVGVINTTARAFVGAGAKVEAGGNVRIVADVETDLISVAASLGIGTQKLGLAGSGASQTLHTTVEAFVEDSDTVAGRAQVKTGGSLLIDAAEDAFLVVVGGAAAFGKSAGIGASVGNANVERKVRAYVGRNAKVDAKGAGAAITDPGGTVTANGIVIDATADDRRFLFGAGGAGGKDVAFEASVVVDTHDSEVTAAIGRSALVNTDADNAGAADAQSVQLRAHEDLSVLSVAGAIAGAGKAGIGAAADVEVISRDVKASIGADAVVVAKNHVTVDASTEDDFILVAAGFGGAGKVGLAGSAVVATLDTSLSAAIDSGAQVSAGGSVRVSADRDQAFDTVAGVVAVAGSAGFGASASTLIVTDDTEALIGAGARVSAKGLGGTLTMKTGLADDDTVIASAGRGVSVSATSRDDLLTIAAGGAGGGSAGIAGSAVVNKFDQRTHATIADGARVNESTDGAAADQAVHVLATNLTDLISVAGGVAFGGNAGIGAGADVGLWDKDTKASLGTGALVNARGNVTVQALSDEDIISVAANIAAGGSAGIAGSAGVYTMDITTRAFLADAATAANATRVTAGGSVLVAADEDLKIDGVAGNLQGSSTASVGAAAVVMVIDKTTEAFLGTHADVDARADAASAAISPRLGGSVVRVVAETAAQGEVAAPGIRSFDLNLDGTTSAGEGNGVSAFLGGQRVSTAVVANQFRGVAVTATNRDDIETVGASGGVSGNVVVNVGGDVNVITNHTKAFVDDSARVNQDVNDAGGSQSVIVAAGNDFYHMGIAAVGAISGTVAVTPGAAVTILSNETLAFIDDGANVAAADSVSVRAIADEDILAVAAGLSASGQVGVAGSATVITIDNVTQAFIGDDATTDAAGAKVRAGGSVLVEARDDTEIDTIAGSAGIGLGAVGVGASAAVTLIDKATDAFVGDHAAVDALGNGTATLTVFDGTLGPGGPASASGFRGLAVQAATSEDLFSIAAAGGVGFYAGIAGGVSVQIIDSDTQARIGVGADVNQGSGTAHPSQGVAVVAVNAVDVLTVGGGAGAGIAGIGGGVDVGIVRNDTGAIIAEGAKVDAAGAVDVNAVSDKDIESYALSAAAGIVGAVGSVSVWTVGGQFDATYSTDSGSANALTPQSARSSNSGQQGAQCSSVTGYVDAMGGGTTGNGSYRNMGGGYRQGVSFTVAGSVNADADTIRSVAPHGFNTGDAVVYRASGAPVGGLTDGRTYYVIASDTDLSELRLGASVADARAGRNVGLEGGGGAGQHSLTPVLGSATGAAKQEANSAAPTGRVASAAGASGATTGAAVTAAILSGAEVTADTGSIDVTARGRLDFDVKVGAAAAGVVGIGGAVGIANFADDVQAFVESGSTLSAGGDVTVLARYTSTADGFAFAGTAGLVGLAAQVILINDRTDQRAYLGDDRSDARTLTGTANIVRASAVRVSAEADRDVDVQVIGGAIAGVAAGASVGRGAITGTTGAFIDGSVRVGQLTDSQVASVAVKADARDVVVANVRAVAGGIIAGSGSDARATDSAIVSAFVGDDAVIGVTGSITVDALTDISGSSDALGVSVGGVAIGVSLARTALRPQLEAQVGGATIRAGGNLSVRAQHNMRDGNSLNRTARASANASGGGALAGNGADVLAEAEARGTASLGGAGGDVEVGGSIAVRSNVNNRAVSVGDGLTIGVVGIGAILADAEVEGAVEASVADDTRVRAAGDITVEARRLHSVDASAEASGGGLASGNGADVEAVLTGSVTGFVGDSANVTSTGGSVRVEARSEGRTDADARGVSIGALAVGASLASARETVTVIAETREGAVVDARNDVRILSNHNTDPVSNTVNPLAVEATAGASAGALIGLTGSRAAAASTLAVHGRVGQGSHVTAGRDVIVTGRSGGRVESSAVGLIGGLAAAGINVASATAFNRTNVVTGADSLLEGERNATLSAVSLPDVDSRAVGGVGGVLAGASTSSVARIDGATLVQVGDRGEVHALAGAATLEALSAMDADGNATITTGGLATFNQTMTDVDVTQNTDVRLSTGAVVTGQTTRLAAQVLRLDADADAFSKTFAAASTSDAQALLDVTSRTFVNIANGASVTGATRLDIVSRQDGMNTRSEGEARIGFGVTGIVKATGRNQTDNDSDVNAVQGSALRGEEIVIDAQSPRGSGLYTRTADAEAGTVVQTIVETIRVVENVTSNIPIIGWIVKQIVKFVTVVSTVILQSDERETLTGNISSDNSITLNGDIFLGSAAGVAVDILADGTIVTSGDIRARRVTNGGVTTIQVDDVTSTLKGRLEVKSPSGRLTGNAVIHKGNVLDRIAVTNRSDFAVVINDINPVNPDIGDPQLVFTSGQDTSRFSIVGDLAGSPEVIVEGTTGADVIFAGVVANPNGSVTVTNARGNVVRTADGRIEANRVTISTPLGSVGTEERRLDVRLFDDREDARLQATAGRDVLLDVRQQQILEGPPAPGMVLDGARIDASAGGRTDIVARQAQALFAGATPEQGLLATDVAGVYGLGNVSGGSVDLDVTGDARLVGLVGAPAGLAILRVSGSLLAGSGQLGGAGVVVVAGRAIGTAADPVASSALRLEAQSGIGGIFLAQSGPLTIGGLSTLPGLSTSGSVRVVGRGPIRVEESITASGSVTLTALDVATRTDNNLTIATTVRIFAFGGAATIEAGDRLEVEAGAIVTGSAGVVVHGEAGGAGDADAEGASILIAAVLGGTNRSVVTGAGDDTIDIRSVGVAGLAIDAGGGADTIRLGSLVPIGASSLETLLGDVTVTGGGGDDTLSLDASAIGAASAGILAASSIEGFGLGARVSYGAVENVSLQLGAGNDRIRVKGSTARTTIRSGGGDDLFEVTGDDDTLGAISGVVVIDGGEGADTVRLSDSGATGPRIGTLSASALRGLGMAGGIDFADVSAVDLTLGSGADSLAITGTAASVNTTVSLGGGTDTVTVGPSLELFDGVLLIDGDAGDDLIRADDRQGTDGAAGELAGDRILGFGIAAGTAITYRSFAQMEMRLGDGGDNVRVTATSTPTALSTGGGADLVVVEGTSHRLDVSLGDGEDVLTAAGIGAALAIDAGSGADRVTVTDTLGEATVRLGAGDDSFTLLDAAAAVIVEGEANDATGDVLIIDRSARSEPDSGAITDGSEAGQARISGVVPGVTLRGIERTEIRFGTNADRFTVDTGLDMPLTLLGGAGSDSVEVRRLGGLTDFVGGGGQDSLTLLIADDPVARTDIADRLTVSAEELVVDNRAFTGGVDWIASQTALRAARNGAPVSGGVIGNRLVDTVSADRVRVLGSGGVNSLRVEQPEALDATATIDGNRVELVSGTRVIQPSAFERYEYRERAMSFEGLVSGATSYTESGLRLAADAFTGAGLARLDAISASARTGRDDGVLILTTQAEGFLDLRSVSMRIESGARTVTFTGTRADGTTVTHNVLVDSPAFRRFVLPSTFTNLRSVTWVPGSAIVDDLVASPVAVQRAVVEPGNLGGTMDFDALVSGSTSYSEDGMTLVPSFGQFFVSNVTRTDTGQAIFPSHALITWTLTASNGSPFTLRSLSVRELNGNVEAQTLEFVGTRLDGSTVRQTFVTNGPGPVVYERVNFGDAFVNVVSVTWGPGPVVYDEIVVEAARFSMNFNQAASFTTRYQENGAVLTVANGQFIVSNLNGFGAITGEPAIFTNPGPSPTVQLTMADGGLFELRSLRLRENNFLLPPTDVFFRGVRSDGSTVEQVVRTIVSDNFAYQTVNFGPGFTDLLSVTWEGSSVTVDDIAFRPIRVTPVRPVDPVVDPALPGIDAIATSPDGATVYGVNAARNALVVIDGATLKQRQLLVDGIDGVDGLLGASAVTVDSAGAFVYVAGTEGKIARFERNRTTGDLRFLDVRALATGETAPITALTLSPDGQRLFVEVANPAAPGIRILGSGLKAEFYTTGQPLRDFPAFDRLLPLKTRTDATLQMPAVFNADFFGQFDPDVPADNFAVRWSGQIEVAAPDAGNASVTFSLGSDDGSRLFIDGALVLANGVLQDFTTRSVTLNLATGVHDIRVEYFDATEAASIRLEAAIAGQPLRLLSTGPAVAAGAGVIAVRLDDPAAGPIVSGPRVALAGIDDLTAMVASRDGSHLYAVSRSQSALVVLDAATLQERQRVSGADFGLGGPVAVAVSPDDRHVYVASADGNGVSVFERSATAGTLSLVQTVRSGGNAARGLLQASGVAVSPDGAFVYVTGRGADALTVFERRANGSLAPVQLVLNNNSGSLGLESPTGVVVSSDGRVLVSSAAGQGGDVRGGVASFAPLPAAGTPSRFEVVFERMAALEVATGSGNDVIDLRVAPNLDGDRTRVATTISTGSGRDLVNVLDAAGSVRIRTGEDADTIELRAEAAGATLSVDAGSGSDAVFLRRIGTATVTVTGGDDADVIAIDGNNVATGASVLIDGASPVGTVGDLLRFSALPAAGGGAPQLRTDLGPVATPSGAIGAIGAGAVNYRSIEVLDVLAAPDAVIAPVATFSEGGTLVLDGSSSRLFGRTGRFEWDIDGDGLFGEVTGARVSLTWDELKALGIRDEGMQSVALRLTNDLGLFEDAFARYTVTNVPPVIGTQSPDSVAEGARFELQLSVTDPGDDTIVGWTIRWGDGTSDTFAGDARVVSHVYADDSAGQAPSGRYTISIEAVDEDGTVTVGTSVLVVDVPPTVLLDGAASVPEGSPYRLNLAVQDPGADTVDRWEIDWGDGTVTQLAGSATFADHVYADNGERRIAVVARNEDTSVGAERVVTVLPVTPTLTASGPAQVNEGGVYRLTLGAVDPGADTISGWTVRWGDGAVDRVDGSVTTLEHVYADDSGTGTFGIEVEAVDEDGTYTTRTAVAVRNVLPSITLTGADSVAEGALYRLDFSAVDPGTDTVARWIVSWDDGTVDTFDGATTFATHVFSDDGLRQVTVTAEDEDGVATAARAVRVLDVKPTLTITGADTVAEGALYTLALSATDPGADVVTSWLVRWGDGRSDTVAGASAVLTHVYADDSGTGRFTIEVVATDEAGETTASSTVRVTDTAPQIIAGVANLVEEGALFPLTLSAVDAGTDRVIEWVVDWGDGTVDRLPGAVVQIEQPDGNGGTTLVERDSVTLTHRYADDSAGRPGGVYTVRYSARNEDGTFSGTADITVVNVAPRVDITGAALVVEGSPYTLVIGAIADPGDDTLSAGLSIDWGDGTVDQFTTIPASLTHTFADDGEKRLRIVITDEDGSYELDGVSLTIADDPGTPESEAQELRSNTLFVRNVAPTITVTGAAATREGEPFALQLAVADPGTDTVTQWNIDWGDGATETLEGSVRSLSHVYRLSGDFTVVIEAIDEDGTYRVTRPVAVTRVAPTVRFDALPSDRIDEGDSVTLTGSIELPAGVAGTRLFSGTATWSDGVTGAVDIDPSTGRFAIARGFADDHPASGTAEDRFTVTVSVSDQFGDAATASASLVVRNVAPLVTGLTLDRAAPDEGDEVTLSGGVFDLGVADTHAVSIDWGDGTVAAVTVDPSTRQFTATHRYLDNAAGGQPFVVAVTATDDDTGVATAMIEVAVRDVAPTLSLTGPGQVLAGRPLTLATGSADPGNDRIAFWTFDWGDGTRQRVDGNPASVSHVYAQPGSYTVLATATDEDGTYDVAPFAVAVLTASLQVTDLAFDRDGFAVRFNDALDPVTLNAFGGTSLGASADIRLTGQGGVAVRGSILLDADLRGLRYLVSGEGLAPGEYAITLVSGADAFVGARGLLDGDFDGTAGGDFRETITVGATPAARLEMADFMRGPGQAVNLPATGAGIPITLQSAGGATAVEFEVRFDPSLLTVTGATLGSGAGVGAALVVDPVSAGVLRVSITAPAGVAAGRAIVAALQATVPADAAYGVAHAVEIVDVRIDGAVVAGAGGDALHVAGYLGDSNASRAYEREDALLTQRVIVGTDRGYDAWGRFDPVVIADTDGNRVLTASDAARVLQESQGIDRAEIPAIPLAPPPSPFLPAAATLPSVSRVDFAQRYPDMTLKSYGPSLREALARTVPNLPAAPDASDGDGVTVLANVSAQLSQRLGNLRG